MCFCIAETDLSLSDIPEVAHYDEDKRPGEGTSPRKVLLFCQVYDKPPLTCHSHLPYIRHVNHKVWYKRKYIRARSFSYPVSKILHPLPRLVEVDETLSSDDLSLEPRIPRVHEFHWADVKLSHGWLHRINSVKSTLTSKNATSSEENNHHKFALSATSDGASHRKQIRFNESKNTILTILTPKIKEQIDRETPSNSETRCGEKFQRRKPDSTYITLISGLTHDTIDAKSTGACVENKTVDPTDHLAVPKLQGKEANRQNLKCTLLNGLVHCKLLCLCPVNLPLQRSNSLEYIQQISSLGC